MTVVVSIDRTCYCFDLAVLSLMCFVFFFKQKTEYEVRIIDWSSDVCSSDLIVVIGTEQQAGHTDARGHTLRRTTGAGGFEILGLMIDAHARRQCPVLADIPGELCKRRFGARALCVVELVVVVADHRRQQRAEDRKAWQIKQRQRRRVRSEEHTSELQSLMRISYAVFCLKKKKR